MLQAGARRKVLVRGSLARPVGSTAERGSRSSSTKGLVSVLGRKIRDALSAMRLLSRVRIIQSRRTVASQPWAWNCSRAISRNFMVEAKSRCPSGGRGPFSGWAGFFPNIDHHSKQCANSVVF